MPASPHYAPFAPHALCSPSQASPGPGPAVPVSVPVSVPVPAPPSVPPGKSPMPYLRTAMSLHASQATPPPSLSGTRRHSAFPAMSLGQNSTYVSPPGLDAWPGPGSTPGGSSSSFIDTSYASSGGISASLSSRTSPPPTDWLAPTPTITNNPGIQASYASRYSPWDSVGWPPALSPSSGAGSWKDDVSYPSTPFPSSLSSTPLSRQFGNMTCSARPVASLPTITLGEEDEALQTEPIQTHHAKQEKKFMGKKEHLASPKVTAPREPLDNDLKRHVLLTGAQLSHLEAMPSFDLTRPPEGEQSPDYAQSLHYQLAKMQQILGEQENMITKLEIVISQVRNDPTHKLRLYHSNSTISLSGNPPRGVTYWIRELLYNVEHPRASLHASCLMQLQLAWSPIERKQEIVKTVRDYIVPLSMHQHGNWLVQKAIKADFSLIDSVLGNCIPLALSDFGYHVLVYILRSTHESYARSVVTEMLSHNVYETFRSKSSIHVWQQALGVHWVEVPTFRDRMIHQLNTVLRGRWADIATSEWGSILLQSWFESAATGEKREAIEELVAASPTLFVHPRAVWVMEHILKFGDPGDKSQVLDSLVQHAVLVTRSQSGHKVIAEALHQGDSVFVSHYARAICHPQPQTHSQPSFPSGLSPLLHHTAFGAATLPDTFPSPSVEMKLNLIAGPALIDLAVRDHGGSMVMTLLSKCDPTARDLVLRTVARNASLLRRDPHGSRVEKMCREYIAYLNDYVLFFFR